MAPRWTQPSQIKRHGLAKIGQDGPCRLRFPSVLFGVRVVSGFLPSGFGARVVSGFLPSGLASVSSQVSCRLVYCIALPRLSSMIGPQTSGRKGQVGQDNLLGGNQPPPGAGWGQGQCKASLPLHVCVWWDACRVSPVLRVTPRSNATSPGTRAFSHISRAVCLTSNLTQQVESSSTAKHQLALGVCFCMRHPR